MGGVDWRDRFGTSYVTSIRYQQCEDCWTHAAVALVEREYGPDRTFAMAGPLGR